MAVPTAAIVGRNGLPTGVYVAHESTPNRYERVRVRAGESERGRTTILAGISVGARVVVRGAALLECALRAGSEADPT